MTDRAALARRFLAATDWAAADVTPVAGDASNRRYDRLARPDGATAILMDAPADKGEDVRPFVRIARYLRGLGLSAPDILAEDTENGFLLLEDLGDDLYARVLRRHPGKEAELYTAAVDALIALHRAAPPDLAPYDAPLMTRLSELAFARYAAGVTGSENADALTAFARGFQRLLAELTGPPSVLIQRDYHAENLLWLPQRSGVARVGMLDFQDAALGHPAYDLVSLLQDARRDVSPDIEDRMLAHYIGETQVPEPAFRDAYAALGVQRNLRILGVFARLSLDHGKPHYVDLIPRVWGHLVRGLSHPALAPVRDSVLRALPEPDARTLARLKSP